MRYIVVLVCVLGLMSCAGALPIPKQIPDTISATCDLYEKARPEVISARAFAAEHWNDKLADGRDLIPPQTKSVLLSIDSALPELDEAGRTICAARDAILGGGSLDLKNVDWNQVLTVAAKGIGMALDLRTIPTTSPPQ